MSLQKMQGSNKGETRVTNDVLKEGDRNMSDPQERIAPRDMVVPAVQTPQAIALRKWIMEQIEKEGGNLGGVKLPRDWTEKELLENMSKREKEKNEGRRKEMMEREREWFDHYYSNGEVQYDETGKMIQPRPIRPVPREPVTVKDKDGADITDALKKLLDQMPAELQDDYVTLDPMERGQEPVGAKEPSQGDAKQMVKKIQSGLNILSGKKNQAAGPASGKTAMLKEDGIIGPKTAQGLQKALVKEGTGKVSEALALGQFKETVKKAKTAGPQNLAAELGATFSPLIGNAKSPKQGFQPEGLVLQDTLNDLGENLMDDGIVGPKTQAAFGRVAKSKPEDEIVAQFAHNLAFDL